MLTWLQRFHLHAWALSSMWLIPLGFLLLAVVLAFVMPWVDRQIVGEPAFAYSAGSAQATLSAIASGMLVFTGFVFSILTFAIQYGSSTYSPRLIRSVTTDTSTKVALGVFIASFTYALLLLAEVAPGGSDYVPQVSVLFAVVLVGVSILFFLGLIVRVTGSVRSGRVVADIDRIGREVIDTTFPEPASAPSQPAFERHIPDMAGSVVANPRRGGGVVQAVNPAGIVTLAEEAGAMVEMVPAIGEFVPTGAPMFRVSEPTRTYDVRRLLGFVALGDERTVRQDPSYAIRVLVDIAIRALSPGINDPTTALEALYRIEDLLLLLGTRQLPDGRFCGGDGEVRFVYRTPTWHQYLSLALTEIRTFGANAPTVVEQMGRLLDELRALVPPWRHAALDEQSRLLEEAAAKARR